MKNIVIFGMLGLIVGAGGMFAYFFFSPTPTKAVETAAVEPLKNEIRIASDYTTAALRMVSGNAHLRFDIRSQLLNGWLDIPHTSSLISDLTQRCSYFHNKANELISINSSFISGHFLNSIDLMQNSRFNNLTVHATNLKDSIDYLSKLSVYEYAIYAYEDWKDSGIKVDKEDIILINVSGKIRLTNRNVRDDVKADANWGTNELYDYRRYSDVGTGAVLMRVRGGGVRLANTKGSNKTHISDANGTIEFTVNDNTLNDNTGTCKIQLIIINAKLWKAYENASGVFIQ